MEKLPPTKSFVKILIWKNSITGIIWEYDITTREFFFIVLLLKCVYISSI